MGNSSDTQKDRANSIGFSSGVDWNDYMQYRPIYTNSFFDRIYAYHSSKPTASWTTAHDIGAGCGIVAASLAPRFRHLIVSDPVDEYIAQAKELLIERCNIPASKIRFEVSKGEQLHVDAGSVDLMTVCECIHWMEPAEALAVFAKQIRSGGTLAITGYYVPSIENNDIAQKHWAAIWQIWGRCNVAHLFERAVKYTNTGFESIGFPGDTWRDVKRVYVNARGTIESFKFDERTQPSQFREGAEERVWVEDDPDWVFDWDMDEMRGYIRTMGATLDEDAARGHWEAIEQALGGQKARLNLPMIMLLATKA